ncbi:hypothetical protein V1503_24655 [Bacillus sp. SCS-151]|uniref:hypothetical protein n=1 Tax=Nanhaiella sioensis TaxID=3115293 RepID=UPI00397C3B31
MSDYGLPDLKETGIQVYGLTTESCSICNFFDVNKELDKIKQEFVPFETITYNVKPKFTIDDFKIDYFYPAVIIFKNGNPVEKIEKFNPSSIDHLRSLISKHLYGVSFMNRKFNDY